MFDLGKLMKDFQLKIYNGMIKRVDEFTAAFIFIDGVRGGLYEKWDCKTKVLRFC